MIRTRKQRDILVQIVVVGLFLGTIAAVGFIAFRNVQALGMSYGWSFLQRETGILLTSTWPFESSTRSTYLDAILYGTANTLRLALIVIVFSLLLGIVIGAARLSSGPAAWLASLYIQVVRGPSLLLHVLFWYTLTRSFGTLQAAYRPGDLYILSNRGVFLPGLSSEAAGTAFMTLGVCLGLAVLARLGARNWLNAVPSRKLAFVLAAGFGTIGAAIVAVLALHRGQIIVLPVVTGFRVTGGISMSPEFFAFSAAAIFYIANYVAEIIRQGIQSVDAGLSEAAAALALKPWQTFLLIQLPVAMRNMLPPFTNLVTFIVKSTAAATAVGFSELFTVTSLSINHTGHVIELLLIMVAIYLVVNSLISLSLNALNKKLKIVTR